MSLGAFYLKKIKTMGYAKILQRQQVIKSKKEDSG
jgi:hypothetical protein